MAAMKASTSCSSALSATELTSAGARDKASAVMRFFPGTCTMLN